MTNQGAGRRRPTIAIIIGVIVLIGAIAGAAYGVSYVFFREPAPAPVDTDHSTSAEPSQAAPSEGASTGAAASAPPSTAAAASTWSVDASIGSFDDFSGSFVGYRVQEELAGIGGQTAVGRTPDVIGSLTLEGATLTSVEMTADLTTLVSDDDRRDNQLRQQALETNEFPSATFVLTETIELADDALAGETVETSATGELTLHGETRAVEIPITATLSDGVITVTGSIEIVFADYGMEKPNSFLVLSVDDFGVMEFQLHFTEG
ncbi:MAG TPA: YceI family protein [Candidatus Limnocylindria bacterium]